jgi:hypothetical protein
VSRLSAQKQIHVCYQVDSYKLGVVNLAPLSVGGPTNATKSGVLLGLVRELVHVAF